MNIGNASCLLMQGAELCLCLGFQHIIVERDGNKLGGSADGTPLEDVLQGIDK